MEFKDAGNEHFKQQQWEKAIEAYSKGLALPGEALEGNTRGILYSNRSQCYIKLGDYQQAVQDADESLKLMPTHCKSLLRRATAYEQLGKHKEALSDFVKLVKLEPQNQQAVQGARRMRDQVSGNIDQQRNDVLPVALLGVLKSEAGDTEKIDACTKLRGHCVHKGLTRAMVRQGAGDALIGVASAEKTSDKLRAEALAVLVVMASGYEVEDEEDTENKKPHDVNKPLPVKQGAEESRDTLRRILPLTKLLKLCAKDSKSMRELIMLLGYTHGLDDKEALEAINRALAFGCEDGKVNVPKAGVLGLARMGDSRRRLGRKAKAFKPSREFLKCAESAMNVTSCFEELQNFLASTFALLADSERSDEDKIDLPQIALQFLEPFLASTDIALQGNGLAALALFFAADSKQAALMLNSSATPLQAILTSLTKAPDTAEGHQAQSSAAECLVLAMGDTNTRKNIYGSGGVSLLLDLLKSEKGMLKARIVCVLAMLSAHNSEIREEIFDRADFMYELRDALAIAKEYTKEIQEKKTQKRVLDECRRVVRGLYESCACLTIHGEFKEKLQKAKKTLQTLQDILTVDDLAEDKHLSFLYATLVYNLCRSREDKIRPKKNEFPFNELQDDDLNALEEFYEKLPAESRPVKNGELDAGSKELAEALRKWCVITADSSATGNGVGSPVVRNLAKCAAVGSDRVKVLVALIMRALCIEEKHRRYVVSGGGVRCLCGLVDLEDEPARDAARQAMAQICIVTKPTSFTYSEQLDMVRPLVELLSHKHELLQFEAAMGLTNLLTVGEEIQSRALQADAWTQFRELLFSENEMVQRAGLECMCNVCMHDEVLEKFAEGKRETEIKVMCAFALSDDVASQSAATGGLAMLSGCPEVAVWISKSDNFERCFLALLEETKDAGLQHRCVACLCNVWEADGVDEKLKERISDALKKKKLISPEAEKMKAELLKG